MSVDDSNSRPISLRLIDHPIVARVITAVVSGLGGFVTIYLLARLSATLGAVLLIAPFGASCVLVFALPHSPLAQPNVIGGHFISAFVGLAVLTLFSVSPLT